MRKVSPGLALLAALLLPSVARAQVYALPEPYPQVTAAGVPWQMRGDPVFHAGYYYYPTGPSVFFDGFVMHRTGTYRGVPLFEDATIEPYSIMYVPIGGNVVRPYERPRAGDLVGTVGSRTPSFPIQRDGELSLAAAMQRFPGVSYPPIDPVRVVIPEEARRPEEPLPAAPPESVSTGVPVLNPALPRYVILGTPPRGARAGVWVPYDNARWYSSGSAVVFQADQFTQIGNYNGFPVYRRRGGRSDEIYIPSVEGGAVAPFRRSR
jgi:hypothetical protein